jgi:diguanylate cyclase (GGDEF)-like protein/PAS domain S-box-containing protein
MAGFSVTYFLQRQALNAANQIQQDNFDYQTREITLRIEQRLAAYEQVLFGTKSLFAASKVVNREAFRIYVENLRLENRFPGIQGVGFSLIIKPSEKAKHIQAVRNEGYPNYTLHPEGERDLYTSIIYLEPFSGRNQRPFGYDMYSESVRRKAMEHARDSDIATISGKVKLLQEIEPNVQAGFLMYVPVYRNDRPHNTLEERRANIVGWTYAPFRMDDLMLGILGEQIQNFDLNIYDGEVITPEALMNNIESELSLHQIDAAQFQFSQKIEFVGHIWTIRLHSLPTFEAKIDTERVKVIRLAGVLITLLLTFLITLLSSGRSRAVKLAESMTRELRDSENNLRNISIYTRNLIEASLDPLVTISSEGKITDVNIATERVTGVDRDNLIGSDFADYFVDPAIAREGYEQAFSQGFVTDYPLAIRHVSGKITDVLYNASVYRNETGDIQGIFAAARDVTELKQTELKKRTSEEQLLAIYKLDLVGLAITSPEKGWIRINDCLCNMLEYSEQELRRMTWAELTHPEDLAVDVAQFERMLANEIEGYSFEKRFISRTGKVIFTKLVVRCLRKINGQVDYVAAMVEDVSERKRYEDKLRLAANVFTHAREGIMITDPDGTIVDVNETFSLITGYSRDEVIGHNPRMLSSGRNTKEYYAALWQDLIEKGYWYGETWNRHKNGEVYAEMQNITAVRDTHGNTQHYVSLFSDITLSKNHEQELEHIAHYDVLTNLPNRVLLADRLQQAMPQVQRREQHLVVVFLDLDGFKAINDNHGHKTGDQLLMTVALRMKQTLREGDTLARLGGDEFVAVLTDLNNIEASVPMLTRLLDAAALPVHIGDLVLQVSASLGATVYPQVEDIDADQLLRQADQAMYQAKLAGKNRYHIFDGAHDTSIRVRHENLDRIHEAIIKQEFVLYYQPKVNMRTGTIIGAEALIRWNHPEKGLLLPALFLPEIEDHPLAIELGEWVIDSALTQLELWRNEGLDIQVSVNIGARQLKQDNFITRLSKILAAHPDIIPSYLELEVLETSALEDITKASLLIDECRKIGVNFALDDFGTGYSSLTYLKRLPVALLKIDQSFVRDMLNDPDDLAIIEAIVGLAHTFRREVIAEGVETVEHGTFLLKLGCDMAQGYGIARPMPADQLPKWSITWRPDSAWIDQPLMSHDDLLLLFASVEQHSRIASIEAFLKGERDAPLPLDPYQTRLSLWMNTERLRNQNAQPVFEAIDSLHRQIQALSNELCELQTRGRNSEALAKLGELHDLRDALIEQLKVPAQKA